jgi:hypothetical protein
MNLLKVCLLDEEVSMKAQTEKTKSTHSPTQLSERAIQRRAVEAVVWGMPAVNTDLMYQAMVREIKGNWNQIVYWSRLLDWKNQTLTPNPDAIYMMTFFNTATVGPMVIEIPPANGGSITGSIMDVWASDNGPSPLPTVTPYWPSATLARGVARSAQCWKETFALLASFAGLARYPFNIVLGQAVCGGVGSYRKLFG